MGNLIIKGKGGAGNKLIIQDQAGGAVLTNADAGATLGNSTQDNITRLGTVTSGGFASGNRQSVEIWYEGRACHNNASYTEHQEIGDWGIPFNMEVGNHNVVGRAPAGFTAVSAIKVGVMNIQGQFANQGISVRWMIAAGAGNGQAHNTHSLGNTNASPFPNTNSNSNHVYEANIFNLTGSNDFEDIIAEQDYFAFAFDDLQSHNSAVMGVAITWDF